MKFYLFTLFFLLSFILFTNSFSISSSILKKSNNKFLLSSSSSSSSTSSILSHPLPPTLQALNDIVLVERITSDNISKKLVQVRLKSGLEDQLKVARVVSIFNPSTSTSTSSCSTSCSTTSASSTCSTTNNSKISPNDIVIVQDPWGIGPFQFIKDGRSYSYHKLSNILAKIE